MNLEFVLAKRRLKDEPVDEANSEQRLARKNHTP
jgi:hypothetical protein